MRKLKFVVWSALTPALSPGRGRILRRGLHQLKPSVIRALRPANQQPAATDKLTSEKFSAFDSCSLSPGERVRVRASVPLTSLLRSHVGCHYRSRVVRQRMRGACLQRVKNHVTDELLLSLQLPIPETNLFDAHRSEKLCSLSIVSMLGRMPMMSAVEFDRETGFHAVEVEVVNSTRVVATEFVGAETPVTQPTPHELFRPSLLLALSAGAGCIGHGGSLKRRRSFRKNGFTTALTPALSPRRGRIVRRRSSGRKAVDCSRALARIYDFRTGGAA